MEQDKGATMLRKFTACLIFAAAVTSVALTARAQDAKTVLSNASKAMGADSLKTIQYSGAGTEYALGQAFNPSSAWPSSSSPMTSASLQKWPIAWS